MGFLRGFVAFKMTKIGNLASKKSFWAGKTCPQPPFYPYFWQKCGAWAC